MTIARDALRRAHDHAARTTDDLWFGAGYAVAAGPAVPARAVPPRDPGPAGRDPGQGLPARTTSSRGATSTPRAELDAQFDKLPAEFKARFEAYRDGVNAWHRARRAPTRASCPASSPRSARCPADWTRARLADDRRLPGPHGAERRRRGAGQRARAAAHRAEHVRPAAAAAHARARCATVPGDARAASRRSPAAPRGRSARRFARSRRVPRAACRCPTEKPRGRRGASSRAAMAGIGRTGGSNMWAIRERERRRDAVQRPAARLPDPRAVRRVRAARARARRARRHRARRAGDRRSATTSTSPGASPPA